MAICHSSWNEHPDKTAKEFKQALVDKLKNEINYIIKSDSYSVEYIQGLQHALNIIVQEKDF